jgi:hypothetical protein
MPHREKWAPAIAHPIAVLPNPSPDRLPACYTTLCRAVADDGWSRSVGSAAKRLLRPVILGHSRLRTTASLGTKFCSSLSKQRTKLLDLQEL